jgi:two-component system NtrC family sensor kinase
MARSQVLEPYRIGRLQNENAPPAAQEAVRDSMGETRSYYQQLERRFFGGLLFAFVLPLALLSAYFHFQFHVTLKKASKLNLSAIAESQRNTVDLFIQERLVNIFALFHSNAFSLSPSQDQMDQLLRQLRRANDAFVDVGFLKENGFQIGYAGPYPYLQNKDYSNQQWFVSLMSSDQNYAISDIYLGFRNKLHFTIAAKQFIDDRIYIMRATLDPDKFYLFLETISHGKGVASILINRQGRVQLAGPLSSLELKVGTYIPDTSISSGTQVIDQNGDTVLVAHAWLSEVQWALMVSEPLNLAYAQFYRARRIMLISTSILLIIIVSGIWMATRSIISKARDTAEKKEELAEQLLHAGKLAALGELATGVAHEINNPLAVIVATTGVIKDMLDPQFEIDRTDEHLLAEVKTIESAVFRARGITMQLLNFGHKNQPRMVGAKIEKIVEDVLGGFKEHSLALADIEVIRNFQPDLPEVEVDPDQMAQVLLNLINNAGDALEGRPGIITISISSDEKKVSISISDTGKGMDGEEIKKIFNPFFTTKEVGKGTGLGLSVSLGIVESMGGSIEVQSLPGAGSVFTVVLPIHQRAKGAVHV